MLFKVFLLICMITHFQDINAQVKMHSTNEQVSGNTYLLIMDTMMEKMDNIPESLSPEADFILQMIPHHTGALAMAENEIKFGKQDVMVQLARSIQAEQGAEIQEMKIWLAGYGGQHFAIPVQYRAAMKRVMNVMMEQLPDAGSLKDGDHAFALVMIPHHQAAVEMAKIIISFTTDLQIEALAKNIISNEEVELEQMKQFLNR